MQFHTLKSKTKRKRSVQVGRGGTRGKTSGRGTKGQNARAGHKNRPELRDFIKRFPKLRGRGVSSFKSIQVKASVLNLNAIDKAYNAGEEVNHITIAQKGILNASKLKSQKIKILGTGEISKKLVFKGLSVSESAKQKIEKAGGQVVNK